MAKYDYYRVETNNFHFCEYAADVELQCSTELPFFPHVKYLWTVRRPMCRISWLEWLIFTLVF